MEVASTDRVNPNIPEVDIETGELTNGRVVSHGTAPVLKKLYEMHALIRRPTYEYYLFNIATIIRNILSSEENRDTVVKSKFLAKLNQELDMIKFYVSQYSIPDTDKGLKIQLVFYYPSYATIHEKYLRKPNKHETMVNSLLTAYHRQFYDTMEVYENIYTHVVTVGKKTSPHRELNKYLLRHDINSNYKRICMVSHVPLDYHFSSYTPKYELLRSFTGDIKTRDMFGEMVFKYNVPFNQYTHLIYGDNKYIRTILSSKQKKKVEEVALKNKWKYKTEYSIMEYLVKSGLVPMEYFKYSPV